MKTEYEYIYFERLPADTKTSRWSCRNLKSGGELGQVRWNGQWRQYCYFPCGDCVYSGGCLRDVAEFLAGLMAERKGGSDAK